MDSGDLATGATGSRWYGLSRYSMCLCEQLELRWTDMTKKLLRERPAIREAALTNRDSSEAAGHLHVQGTDGEAEFRVRDRHFGNVLASGANKRTLGYH